LLMFIVDSEGRKNAHHDLALALGFPPDEVSKSMQQDAGEFACFLLNQMVTGYSPPFELFSLSYFL